jgi:hypothetical protein
VEVDLDIHEKVICIEVDLASDDERKIWASFLQRTTVPATSHLLGKFLANQLIGHVLQKKPCRRILKFISITPEYSYENRCLNWCTKSINKSTICVN